MIKWLGENGEELVRTKSIFVCKKEDLYVQIRFLCRVHATGTCSRMLCNLKSLVRVSRSLLIC